MGAQWGRLTSRDQGDKGYGSSTMQEECPHLGVREERL